MKTLKITIRVLIITIILSLTGFTNTFAQKFAYVDSDYILKSIPEYQNAQNEIDELSKAWQAEIEAMFTQVEQMYKAYQADAVLLPEDLKKKREDEIIKT